MTTTAGISIITEGKTIKTNTYTHTHTHKKDRGCGVMASRLLKAEREEYERIVTGEQPARISEIQRARELLAIDFYADLHLKLKHVYEIGTFDHSIERRELKGITTEAQLKNLDNNRLNTILYCVTLAKGKLQYLEDAITREQRKRSGGK